MRPLRKLCLWRGLGPFPDPLSPPWTSPCWPVNAASTGAGLSEWRVPHAAASAWCSPDSSTSKLPDRKRHRLHRAHRRPAGRPRNKGPNGTKREVLPPFLPAGDGTVTFRVFSSLSSFQVALELMGARSLCLTASGSRPACGSRPCTQALRSPHLSKGKQSPNPAGGNRTGFHGARGGSAENTGSSPLSQPPRQPGA